MQTLNKFKASISKPIIIGINSIRNALIEIYNITTPKMYLLLSSTYIYSFNNCSVIRFCLKAYYISKSVTVQIDEAVTIYFPKTMRRFSNSISVVMYREFENYTVVIYRDRKVSMKMWARLNVYRVPKDVMFVKMTALASLLSIGSWGQPFWFWKSSSFVVSPSSLSSLGATVT